MKMLFPQIVNRLEYFVRLVIFLGFASVLCLLARPLQIPIWLDILAVCILFAIRFACMDIPRLRGMRWSPWLALLLVVPIVNIVIQLILLFVPSQCEKQAKAE